MAKRRTRFLTWTKKDPKDETPIDYTFTWADGTVSQFTSEDEVVYGFLEIIRNAWVDTIEKIDGRWKVKIYEAEITQAEYLAFKNFAREV